MKFKKLYKSLKKGDFGSRLVNKKSSSHLLVHGDCLEVMRYISDRSIDLIITDPPYNQSLDYGGKFDDNKPWGEYYSWLKRRLEDVPRILKLTGSFYLMSYPEINARLLPFIEDELKLNFRSWITWHYPTNIGHSRKNFTRSQRSILFFTKTNNYTFNRDKIIQYYKNEDVGKIRDRIKKGYKGRAAYDALTLLDLLEMRIMENYDKPADFQELDILKNVSKDRFNKKHPCQLPLELLRRFILVSSKPGDIVLDPFAGTFTTSAVAAQSNRHSIGIDQNEKYISFGIKRINNP